MKTAPDLELYLFEGCPFCARVTRALTELGVLVTIRDINEDPKALGDLMAARAKRTVPVLRIAAADGSLRWMPESDDIVRYLSERFR